VKLLKLDGVTDMAAANTYLRETFLPQHNQRFALAPGSAVDAHRPPPPTEDLTNILCLKDHRVVGRDNCVRWEGRWFQLAAGQARPHRRQRVEVRQHLDGRVELWAADVMLDYEELPQRPDPSPAARPPLVDRVADHTGPWKPPTDHPWRRQLAVAGSAPARCARLRCASHREPPQRTLLPG
jgi:hypothetical protein